MPFYKKFIYSITLTLAIWCFGLVTKAQSADSYYYQIKVYHYKTQKQEGLIDDYLKKTYLPFLHQNNIFNIGVFKPVTADTADRKIYVFTAYKKWDDVQIIDERVKKLNNTAKSSADYVNAAYNDAPYTRVESTLLKAFVTRLKPVLPKLSGDRAKRVYELRSYESATEQLHYNKVRMFNSGETDLFDRLGFNPVFYGSVIAGDRMPNLMYLTTFNDKADRDKHWDAFGNDAQWKDLSGRKEFQHNVSKGDIIFLYPTDYSDF
ncbi:NIPSNAP family protein [Mucilaginibacter phyllosphaerae]|uniref:NIPSNAP family containing protein n=1 Tax=Mucilaginibacter phyllosphaerae TaxID=1812349 RepID=A0A4Y8AIV2_9SPHI|nr:NIPSNAP family protein [Mucilaginibacter phyllosphaerae]MBB3967985.1 hypothetical protein [Mucilaginibacter phyllosphaerae]TEW68988.1 NIPSNAP family containing protein [Mucilaginibacter phyllosphaerae]GGH02006.1 hypothetical protein GCM10007352_04020 [Mucilaginibacter phyllosphaerae]